MCWTTWYYPELKYATEDIPIFKIIIKSGNILSSFFTQFPYKLHIIYITDLDKPKKIGFKYHINKGFHSYSIKNTYDKKSSTVFDVNSKFVEVYDLDLGESIKIEGIIPKGSVYFVNENGEYVSDKIMLTEIK